MLAGIIFGLIIAWFLTLFGVDDIFINALQPFFENIEFTTNHFYFVFGIVGCISGLIPYTK